MALNERDNFVRLIDLDEPEALLQALLKLAEARSRGEGATLTEAEAKRWHELAEALQTAKLSHGPDARAAQARSQAANNTAPDC